MAMETGEYGIGRFIFFILKFKKNFKNLVERIPFLIGRMRKKIHLFFSSSLQKM